jgi:hypothetical protein
MSLELQNMVSNFPGFKSKTILQKCMADYGSRMVAMLPGVKDYVSAYLWRWLTIHEQQGEAELEAIK